MNSPRNNLAQSFRNVLNEDRSDRQILCDVFGIPYHVSYKADHANKPTPARRPKLTRAKRQEHITLSPKYSNVGQMSGRLFR